MFLNFTLISLLQKFDEAANAFYEGVMLDPESKELVNAFRLFRLIALLVILLRLMYDLGPLIVY
jgi:hypothetical protein